MKKLSKKERVFHLRLYFLADHTIWDFTKSISICWSKGCIKDETILAIYVSKEKTMFNTNQYIKDRKVAEKIKEVMKKKLNRF